MLSLKPSAAWDVWDAAMLKLMMESDGVQKAGLSAATCTCITEVSVQCTADKECHASAGHAFYDNMRVVNA